jgi:hypothetical protein
VPDNETALGLVRRYSFYDLYFLLGNEIFHGYGQGSLRAEGEITKMLMLEVLFNGEVPTDGRALGLYQYGTKKNFITMNEYLRDTEENPTCFATGHDRHVLKLATFFNPFPRSFDNTFTKILCRTCADWILWNFNEFVGQMQQCLESKMGSRTATFAIKVMSDLLEHFPEYNSLIMTLVKERQWEEILMSIKNKH